MVVITNGPVCIGERVEYGRGGCGMTRVISELCVCENKMLTGECDSEVSDIHV